jgi:aerobic-type carbon monoxide dehydrogenase small subunit (CoxS/CutS family)
MSDRCMHAQFTVNGESVDAQVPVRMHLVDYLRDENGAHRLAFGLRARSLWCMPSHG